MALYSGIDTIAFVSLGVYTETYGAVDTNNVASLFASLGLIERAPGPVAASTLVLLNSVILNEVMLNPVILNNVFIP